MKYPEVSIIILNWNGLDDTVECLESLKKITYPNYEVVVVDNGSKGSDVQILEGDFGDYIHLIRNDKNYGYTGGNNMGIRYALSDPSADYFLVLNNDVTVAPDFLTEMVKLAESDKSVGIVGPKTYLYDFPDRLQLVWYRVDMRKGRAFHVGSGEVDRGQYDCVSEVNYVQGSCFLVKRQVIQHIGFLDTSYFCYWDETDYCFRAREAGYKIIYAPKASIWHKKPSRLKPWYKTLRRKDQIDTPPNYAYYMTRNNFKFMKKHASKGQYRSFLLYFFAYRFWFTTAACLLYYRDMGRLVAFMRGVRDGFLDCDAGAKFYRKD